MKKLISLILSVLLMMSVFSIEGFAAATETKIWHEDFEGENPLNGYTITNAEGSVSIDSTKEEFGGSALKIASGNDTTKITKPGAATWPSNNKEDSIIVSFDFMITDTDTEFYMFGSNDNTADNYSNYSQKQEFFCRTKYIEETGTYKLLHNRDSKATDDSACYIADIPLNVKNNITVVFILRRYAYYSAETIYVNGTAYRNSVTYPGDTGDACFKAWEMSGIPQASINDLRFGAKTTSGTSDVYLDNIKVSHYNATTIEYNGKTTLNDVNPYNSIALDYDNFIMNEGTVSLSDKDSNTIAADVTRNGSQLIVTPKEYLDFNSTYTISVSGLKGVMDYSGNIYTAPTAEIAVNTMKHRCSIENTEVKSYGVESVKILIDKDISSDVLEQLSFTCSDGAAPVGDVYTENISDNIYLVIPVTDNLICGREYTISLSDITGFESFEDVKFTVEDGINVTKPQITGLGADDSLVPGTITATVTTDSTIPTTSVMLLYYKGTKLIGVSCKTIEPETAQITTSLTITDVSDCYVKVYVVDSLSNMKPLTTSTTIGR